jgi:hypothetical protein
MNSKEISDILSNALCRSHSKFCGVFAADEIPNKFNNYPVCYVANTDPRGMPGSHWVAYFHPDAEHAEFFDSYGNKPDEFNLKVWPSMTCNSTSFQSYDSDVCGQYCIYFLVKRQHFTLRMISLHLRLQKSPDPYVARFVFLLNLESPHNCKHSETCNLQHCKPRSSAHCKHACVEQSLLK